MKSKYTNITIQKTQKGMTLVIAMIMLLVVTGVGVSAVKMTSTDTMAAGNSVLDMLVFQGAESTLIKTSSYKDLYDIEKASVGSVRNVAAAHLPDEAIIGGKGVLKSTSQVSVVDDERCPVASNFINSGTFSCITFEKEVTTKVLGASANHIEGVAILAPTNAK